MLNRIVIIFTFVFILGSCKVDPEIHTPLPAAGLSEMIPEGFPAPIYTFKNNPVAENTFILGRFLFYEPMLSKDNTISCNSCHQQAVAFAHADHKLSHGIHDLEGVRNSPALFNMTWAPYFMHDAGIPNIELQPIAPIQNPIEMGDSIVKVIAKLQASQKFRTLFKDAFGSEEVTSQRMFRAMAQFMALMYSYNSKYDHYKRHEEGGNLNDAELRGYNLFISKCGSCHQEPLFTDYKIRSNGLKFNPNPALKDSGRAHITGITGDMFKFKTPSLRNIALTGPYMHDGSLTTLEECLDHYTGGVTNLVNLDPLLANNGLQITADQKRDIISFLNTLTDYEFINDKRFSNPNFK